MDVGDVNRDIARQPADRRALTGLDGTGTSFDEKCRFVKPDDNSFAIQ